MAMGITPVLNWARNNARIDASYVREVLGELLATFVLCLFAVGGTCNLSAMGSGGSLIPSFGYAPTSSVFPVAFGYFLATLLFSGVSGAHVNPAISIGMAIAGRLSWIKLHAFILVQLLGGYLGSLTAYAMFKSFFDPISLAVKLQDIPNSGAIFNAVDGSITLGSGFLNEIVLTCLFMMAFLAVKDMWNSRSPRYVQGILIGLVVIGLGLSFGETTGVAINPVRDLCPRIAALTLGWRSEFVMQGTGGKQWWTVGFFAPFIGAIIGSVIYIFVIGAQLRYHDEDDAGDFVTVETGHGGMDQGDKWRANVFVPRLGSPARKQLQQQHHQMPHQQMPVSPYARVQFRHQ